MIYGVDTVSNVTNVVNEIKNQGYSFVIRYYSNSANSKRTSAAEIAAIGNAGLKRVVVYQNIHNTYQKFTKEIAQSDAADAINQAKSVGQPSSTIYFAVDYDASASEIDGNIKVYFQTLQSTLEKAAYGVGVYGSSLTCKKLKEAGIVGRTWLSMSTGWGFGTQWTDWNIRQTGPVTVAGISCDKDEADSVYEIGGW